jgi:dTDP-4-amino-4,6-dideoxy-D-galactose acyltransferase
MNAVEPALCEFLPWDTEFFGCRIARVHGDTLTSEKNGQIDDWCRQRGIQGLYFLSRADDPATIHTAEQNGFRLVDIRVTLSRGPKDSHVSTGGNSPTGIGFRAFQPDDLPGLQAIARTAHQDTRFFSDGHFSRQRAEDFYATWIALESQGRAQRVFVAAVDQQPLGYISCHLNVLDRAGQIGLVGVAPEVREQGIGARLVRAAMDWFRMQEAQKVTVVTQGKNQAAQRLYQKSGFRSRNLELWFHKWYPVPE